MPADPPSDETATVWASTFVPSRSPIPEFGQEGYSVAWVDTCDGRVQLLVSGPRPGPGAVGRIVERKLGEAEVLLFEADPA
ncbi:hypothetical protein [Mycobacterium paraseoulense]|uniref:hypothetical protein n=1 Tax=Mycobacterium paraseoulense TaxID=590652 RepID=UPI00138D2DE4|nr:hypothetical protein [Mycobacterium paraseoulense]MCV7395416.1 hypothetical protein [Mycobacterium paraseoulense]BBZ71807.1 hypothetical protein MPRS_29000 [Mycobacterium paraseoulense]